MNTPKSEARERVYEKLILRCRGYWGEEFDDEDIRAILTELDAANAENERLDCPKRKPRRAPR